MNDKANSYDDIRSALREGAWAQGEKIAAFDDAIAAAFAATEDIIKRVDLDYKYDYNNTHDLDISGAMSDMYTILIRDTGRFTEAFASDLLISIDSMKKRIADACRSDEADTQTHLFGIRESGVDHLEYVRSQMGTYLRNSSAFESYYRRIYAIRIDTTPPGSSDDKLRISVTMKDIRKELSFAVWKIGQ